MRLVFYFQLFIFSFLAHSATIPLVFQDSVDLLDAGVLVDVSFDKKGNAYLVDQKFATIFVLNPEGEVLRSFGKKGDGPGEFAKALCTTTNDEFIWVYDLGRHLISRFDMQGRFLDSQKVLRPISSLKVMGNKFYLSYYHLEDQPDIEVFDMDWKPLLSINLAGASKKTEYCIFDVDQQGLIYAASIDKYMIEVFETSGKPVRTIDKNIDTPPLVLFEPFQKNFTIMQVVDLKVHNNQIYIFYGGNQDIYSQVALEEVDPVFESRLEVIDLKNGNQAAYWDAKLGKIMKGLFGSPVFGIDQSGKIWLQSMDDRGFIGRYNLPDGKH